MNIFEKINKVKYGILSAKLKKSGYNKFSNFNYYELADITPTIITLCNENKLMTQFTFDNDYARLIIIDVEKPMDVLAYTSPMKELQIKGANEIQALGGIETYQRRYLYMMAFDIIEADMFDATSGKTDEDRANAYKFKSGKFKDMTIKEAYNFNKEHLQYLLDNGRSEEIKNYIEILTDLKRTPIPNTEEDQKKRLELINKVKEQHAFVDMEDIYDKFHITDISQLTTDELESLVED